MTKHEAGQRLAMNTLSNILELYCDESNINPGEVNDVELALHFLENKRSKTIHTYICDYAEEVLELIIKSQDEIYKEECKKAKLLLISLLETKARFKVWQ